MKEGWKMVKLGEIVSFSQGVQVPLSEQKTDMLEGYSRFLRIVDYTQGNEPPRYIKINDDKYRVSEKDIAIVRYGTPGFVCRGLSGVIANNLFKINIDSKNFIDVDYLAYVLKSDIFQKTVKKKQNGAALQAITFGTIKEIPIPYPILIEKQHRIVSILDASFEKIDALKKNAEENLKNAKALFQQVLAQELKPKEGWVEKKFENIVVKNEVGLVKNSKEQSIEYKYPYLKMGNITSSNYLDMSSIVNVNATEDEVNRYSLVYGDFLFNTRNSKELVGKSCVYNRNDEICLYNNNIIRFNFINEINPFFINYLFSNTNIKEQLEKIKKGTTNVWAIYYKELRDIIINIPSLETQHRIVRTLDTLSEKCRRLEEVAQQTIRECDALKQSILRQAFSGEL